MSRLALIALLFAGCTEETKYGKCIGAFDDRDPTLVYEMSAWNVGLGIVFFELIIPPLYVVSSATMCPEAVRGTKEGAK